MLLKCKITEYYSDCGELRVFKIQNSIVCIKLTKLRGLSPQTNYTDRLSDRRLSAKLVPTLADRGCRVVSATNSTAVDFGFIDRSRYFLEIAPQLSIITRLSGPRSRPTIPQKNLIAPGIEPGPLNL
jgi:hypothetical protein